MSPARKAKRITSNATACPYSSLQLLSYNIELYIIFIPQWIQIVHTVQSGKHET